MAHETLLDREEAARRLSVKDPARLFDRRYLQRIGLPRVKLGRLVRFRESDIERVIRRSVEPLPTQGDS